MLILIIESLFSYFFSHYPFWVSWHYFSQNSSFLLGIVRILHSSFSLHLLCFPNGLFYISVATSTNLNSTSWDGWKLALYFVLPGQHLRDSPTRSCSPLWDIPLVLLCYPLLICSLVNIRTLFLSCVSLHVYIQVSFSIWGFWILEVHAFWFDLLENKGLLFLCIEFSGPDSSLVFKLWLVICLNQCF